MSGDLVLLNACLCSLFSFNQKYVFQTTATKKERHLKKFKAMMLLIQKIRVCVTHKSNGLLIALNLGESGVVKAHALTSNVHCTKTHLCEPYGENF